MTVTASDVTAWAKFGVDNVESLLLNDVITAVTEHATERYYIDDPMTEAQRLAIIMQVARLWRRRDTPEGIAAFPDLGALRISALDPDVRALLTMRVSFA